MSKAALFRQQIRESRGLMTTGNLRAERVGWKVTADGSLVGYFLTKELAKQAMLNYVGDRKSLMITHQPDATIQ